MARKITDEQIKEIRALLAAGIVQEDVAKQFRLSQSTVSRIHLRKKRYK